MAKHDVYENPDNGGYLLDVQSDLLDSLNTRIVVPLMPLHEAPQAAKRLNPIFEIKDMQVVMVSQFLAAVPTTILGKPEQNLGESSVEITNALDMVFQGF